MTSFKTIAATAIIAVAGTVAAFSGLHMGQSNAAATTAPAAQAKTTYTISLTAKQLATLMHGQQQSAVHRVGSTHHQRQATHRTTTRATYRSSTRSSGSYYGSGSRSGYRCYGYNGSRSGGSRSGYRCGGGCW